MGATGKPLRAAFYLRVSTDGQTVENQRADLERLASYRQWEVVATYEDHAISGAKGREHRPGLDQLMKDAKRRRFDVVACWAVDRLGRSTGKVVTLMDELEQCGLLLFFHRESMDTSTDHGRAMLEMAAVFARLERNNIIARVRSGLDRARANGVKLGRPTLANAKKSKAAQKRGAETEAEVRRMRAEGTGILKIAKTLGIGVGTVYRIEAEMKGEAARAGSPP